MGRALADATDFVGITDNAGERDARKTAKQERNRAHRIQDASIQFQMDQYNDWKNVYGSLQEDLGDYYKNLTGESITAKNLASIQTESQKAQTNVDKSLAQRGLSSSGLEAQSIMQNQYSTAQQKASVRANSDQVAAQQKMQFLSLGLGQGSAMLADNASVSNNASSVSGGVANNALNNATSLGQSNSSTMSNIYGSIAGGMASLL